MDSRKEQVLSPEIMDWSSSQGQKFSIQKFSILLHFHTMNCLLHGRLRWPQFISKFYSKGDCYCHKLARRGRLFSSAGTFASLSWSSLTLRVVLTLRFQTSNFRPELALLILTDSTWYFTFSFWVNSLTSLMVFYFFLQRVSSPAEGLPHEHLSFYQYSTE